MVPVPEAPGGPTPLLRAILNLSRFHRDHERFYASSPRELAVQLQRHGRTLEALADRWSVVEPITPDPFSPYEGADDLTDPVALQLDGVLFMEGEGRPTEIAHLVRDLRTAADDLAATGRWLAEAMAACWELAATLTDIDELADVLGERHRIIADDWQAADMGTLAARLLHRAADLVDGIDLTPAALRGDLTGDRVTPRLLYSAAELIAHAADLCSDSAGLVHENERRWRTFRRRVAAAAADTEAVDGRSADGGRG
jgi:hypothetical protein